jgi:hypothetical protein
LLEVPDGVSVVRFKDSDTWKIPFADLTPIEIAWLESQNDLRKPSGHNTKPVNWAALCARMIEESNARGNPDFRPLSKDTLGFAWNHKIWRFSGQRDEFPIFDESLKWKDWLKSAAGIQWMMDNE